MQLCLPSGFPGWAHALVEPSMAWQPSISPPLPHPTGKAANLELSTQQWCMSSFHGLWRRSPSPSITAIPCTSRCSLLLFSWQPFTVTSPQPVPLRFFRRSFLSFFLVTRNSTQFLSGPPWLLLPFCLILLARQLILRSPDDVHHLDAWILPTTLSNTVLSCCLWSCQHLAVQGVLSSCSFSPGNHLQSPVLLDDLTLWVIPLPLSALPCPTGEAANLGFLVWCASIWYATSFLDVSILELSPFNYVVTPSENLI